MSFQTDFTFIDINEHQAELRREATASRLRRRARDQRSGGRRSLVERLAHRRSRQPDDKTAADA